MSLKSEIFIAAIDTQVDITHRTQVHIDTVHSCQYTVTWMKSSKQRNIYFMKFSTAETCWPVETRRACSAWSGWATAPSGSPCCSSALPCRRSTWSLPPAVQCETGQHQVSHLPTALTHVRVGCPVSELLLSRSMSRSRFSQVFLMMKRNLIQLDDILQISPADDEVEPSTSHASHLTVIGIGAMSSGWSLYSQLLKLWHLSHVWRTMSNLMILKKSQDLIFITE